MPEATNSLVREVFKRLPVQERRRIEPVIAAVTDDDLPTAVRPFMFGGKVVHELYFDPPKLRFFVKSEKIGAIVSPFITAPLAKESEARIKRAIALSDQALSDHANLIIRRAKRWKYGRQVSAFLRRLKTLEDEWKEEFSQLSETTT
jgi:hypothetical protein